jgi:serine/threonine protein kinase/tetratricopeptide (TPR) repeat protein
MATMDDKKEELDFKEAVRQFVEQQLSGKEADLEELISKYPQFEHQIRRKINEFHQVDSLFDTLVRADQSDFANTSDEYDLVGKKVGGFKIEKIIGRGGMGVVYLARDTRLDRSVAVKSIPAELQSSSTAQARFKREAKLLASLNHPNIAAIHDIIEEEESGYLILEYVSGKTLAERIADKPLKLDEALSIGQQIAEAVSAAHEKGVIHRDLKPGNIKITPDGRVKVLDFGLAKTSVSKAMSDEITVTQPGRIMGTPAYMSPEQARGKDTDHRTDIWSFGCIMYEMLTGHLPFEGETATDTIARILERQPDWEILPQEIPMNIQALLRRCLEKDPDRRLRDIGDAAIEIKETLTVPKTATAARPAAPVRSLSRRVMAIGLVVITFVVLLTVVRLKHGGVSTSQIKSLAVLPLKNYTGDPNQEYFAEYMTDELIASLGKISALRVICRQSVMQYKKSDMSLPGIARELNVGALVGGTVVRSEEKVRITVRLNDGATGSQLWVDSYERDLRDILALQSEVARTIASKIEIKVTPEQEALLAISSPINPEKFDTYAMGMSYMNKMTPDGIQNGLEYLKQAIDEDPSNPRAYGALALAYAISSHGPGGVPEAGELAKEKALKAIEMDSTVPEAHAALAMYRLYKTYEWVSVEKSFLLALDIDSTLAVPRAHYSWYLQRVGRTDEALDQMRKVQEIDPHTPLWPAWLGWQYFWAGQNKKAIEEANKSLELAPDFPVALYVLGCVYAKNGEFDKATEVCQKAAATSSTSPLGKYSLACTYALAGRKDDARHILAEMEINPTHWDNFFIAEIHAFLGEKEQSFQWLDKAFEEPHHSYVAWIKYFSGFKSLRDDPRYDELLRRMDLL